MLISKRTPLSGPVTAAPFVVGVGRSGTTLLRMMLDAHPQMAIPPETHFIPKVVDACQNTASNPAEVFVETLVSHPRWNDFKLETETFREQVRGVHRFNVGDGLRVFYKLYAARFGKSRWGDKTPTYLTQMRLISGLLPEACFIHLIRDGRDVALSIKDLWFGPRSITDAAQTWSDRIISARKHSSDLPNYLELRYEDLLRETEPTLKKICSFLDLPWDDGLLEYHARAEERLAEMSRDMITEGGKLQATAEQRLKIHALTREPPSTSRIGRWKKEMSPADQKQFGGIAGSLLAELGYQP